MSFGSKFLTKIRKRNARCIETSISMANIKDKVAEFLTTTTHLRPSDDLIDIEFDFGSETKGIVPMKIYLRKDVKTKK